MRDTAGGSLSEGIAVANLLHQRRNPGTDDRSREQDFENIFAADPRNAIFSGAVVALVDNGTAVLLR